MQLKQAFTPPERHGPDLLCLSALDGGNGIEYDIALTSCCIVTGNTFATGWLATRVTPGDGGGPHFHRVGGPDDGILRDREYHFCVGEHDPVTCKQYPVVRSFDHWRFPHGDIPSPWKDLQVDSYATDPDLNLKSKAAASARDRTCRISGYFDAVEAAHLVPLADGHWFRSNNMQRYCCLPTDPHPINDERNLAVSTQPFAASSSSSAAHASAVQLALHVMLPLRSGQLLSLYHNRALQQPVRGIPVEFLFARFVWTLFADENMPFLNGAVKHNVLLFDPSEGRSYEEALYSSEVRKYAKLFESYSCGRSVSPRKRQRSSQPRPRTDAEAFETDWHADDGDESSEEQWTRGRRRKRSFEAPERDDCDPPSLGASFISASDASIATAPNERYPTNAPSKGPDEPLESCSKRPRLPTGV
ncbi:hypothetical protein C8A03DRAFT_40738 [Achaetomium macrosporum]|uniref:HNH nuclease domain-containing protein n=1 Tax=Achaetomium macrosporum TaxID=79813 RepID=A0AAN7CH11_9PEZI|nr:hypothetical protein C8A03DRAFT_40738 [Achaetomium macrosporum]